MRLFTEFIGRMREGQVVDLHPKGDDMVVETVAAMDLAAQLAADATVHSLIWQLTRVGTLLFATKLEHLLYPPSDRARGALFRLRIIKWQDLHWEMATYPAADQERVDRLIAECRLRKANGVPTLLYRQAGGDRFRMIGVINRDQPLEPDYERFPIWSPRAWALENAPDWPGYNDLAVAQVLAMQEMEEVRVFFRERGIEP